MLHSHKEGLFVRISAGSSTFEQVPPKLCKQSSPPGLRGQRQAGGQSRGTARRPCAPLGSTRQRFPSNGWERRTRTGRPFRQPRTAWGSKHREKQGRCRCHTSQESSYHPFTAKPTQHTHTPTHNHNASFTRGSRSSRNPSPLLHSFCRSQTKSQASPNTLHSYSSRGRREGISRGKPFISSGGAKKFPAASVPNSLSARPPAKPPSAPPMVPPYALPK